MTSAGLEAADHMTDSLTLTENFDGVMRTKQIGVKLVNSVT